VSDKLREALIAAKKLADNFTDCSTAEIYEARQLIDGALSAPQADAEPVAWRVQMVGQVSWGLTYSNPNLTRGVAEAIPLYTAPPSQSAEMRKVLEIVQRMIKGEMIEASIIDGESMKSLGDLVNETLRANDGKESDGGVLAAARNAQQRVDTWSDAKKDYARRVAGGPSDPTTLDRREAIAHILEPQAWAALGTVDTLAYKNRRTSIRKADRILALLREGA
jgi:hypothetical protein